MDDVTTIDPIDPNIGAQPSGPEGMPIIEVPKVSETEATAETLDSLENLVTPTPKNRQEESIVTPIPVAVPSDNEPSKVIDQTNKITQLHHIENPKGRLTEKADEEEEHFIEEVEKHHGIL